VRLRLEAEPGEIPQKRDELLKALSGQVMADDPELADMLFKAMRPPDRESRHQALRDLQRMLREGYAKEMQGAVKKIGAILQEAASSNVLS
jgi:hypothetical protein